MSSKIFYYSRSGNCARVAHSYAKGGNGKVVQIMDLPEDRYWGGLGFIKGAFHTVLKRQQSYRLVGDTSSQSNEIILVTPVWASQVPATVLAFLNKETFGPETKVTVVTVSDSGNGRTTFRQVVDLLHRHGVQEIRHRNLKSSETNQ